MITHYKPKKKNIMAITLNSKHISLIVFLCSLIVLICMIVCLTSSYWVTAEQFRQGLLYLCIEPGYPIKPRPFALGSLTPGCYPNRDVVYIKISTFLCLITILSTLTATGLTGLALFLSPKKRWTMYRIAMYSMILGLACNFITIILYPTQFMDEIEGSNRMIWKLDFAYGLAWGSSILLLGDIILLLCEHEPVNNDIYTFGKPEKIQMKT